MFIILAPVQLKPEHRDDYIQAAVEAAPEMVSNDRIGCVRCDVIQDADDPNRIWFYEVFLDEAAYQAHIKTPFFKEYIDKTNDWAEEHAPDAPRLGAPIGSSNIWPTDEDWQ